MEIKIGTCPKCKLRVIPKADGTCPNCHAAIAWRGAPAPAPAKGVPPAAHEQVETPQVMAKTPARQRRSARQRRKFPLAATLGAAVRVTWRFKVLWLPAMLLFLFLLAALALLFTFNYPAGVPALRMTPIQKYALSDMNPAVLLIPLMVFLVLMVLANFTTIICFRGAGRVHAGEQHLQLSLLVRESRAYFWRLIGMNFVIGFLSGLVVTPALCLIAALGAKQGGMTPSLLILLLVLMLPASLGITAVMQFAAAALTLEDKRMKAAINRGWDVFQGNVWVSLLLALLLTGLSGLLAGLLTLPLNPILLKLSALGQGVPPPGAWAPIALAAGYGLVYTGALGVVCVFQMTAWAFSFLHLTRASVRLKRVLQTNA